jgi:hypothetical protein
VTPVGLNMRSVGVRGALVLTAAGIAGIVLAVNGWSARHIGLAAAGGGLSVSSPGASPSAASPAPGTAGPSAGPSRPAPSASAAGPLLSSEPYASYAYQVWPGTPSAAARQAMTGLSISASRVRDGISVKAGVNGQPAAAAHTYPGGARVYVVESSLGDDSNSSDYNLGDDGLVVTDVRGRILQ